MADTSSKVSVKNSLRRIVENSGASRDTLYIIPQFTGKNSSRTSSRMRSRDRRSRLASPVPRHSDFFNLYHPPLPTVYLYDGSSVPRFPRCFRAFSNSPCWLPRRPSFRFCRYVPTIVPLRWNFVMRTLTSSRLCCSYIYLRSKETMKENCERKSNCVENFRDKRTTENITRTQLSNDYITHISNLFNCLYRKGR